MSFISKIMDALKMEAQNMIKYVSMYSILRCSLV